MKFLTAKQAYEQGHCLACHTENLGHRRHLRFGDCVVDAASTDKRASGSKNKPAGTASSFVSADELAEQGSRDQCFATGAAETGEEASMPVVPTDAAETRRAPVVGASEPVPIPSYHSDIDLRGVLDRLDRLELAVTRLDDHLHRSGSEMAKMLERIEVLEAENKSWNEAMSFAEEEDQQLITTGQYRPERPSRIVPEPTAGTRGNTEFFSLETGGTPRADTFGEPDAQNWWLHDEQEALTGPPGITHVASPQTFGHHLDRPSRSDVGTRQNLRRNVADQFDPSQGVSNHSVCANLQHGTDGVGNEDDTVARIRATRPMGAQMPSQTAALQVQSAAAVGTRHGTTTAEEHSASLRREELGRTVVPSVPEPWAGTRSEPNFTVPYTAPYGIRGSDVGVPHGFDDVFDFLEQAGRGTSMVSAHGLGATPQFGLDSRFLDARPAREVAGGHGVPTSEIHRGASVPADTLSIAELNMILKALQGCVGEFPTIVLGGMAERPEHLRKWRYAVRQSLEAAGPQVMTWWSWCWEVAESTHAIYMKAPVMNRESIKVAPRIPSRWAQLETWVKPRLLTCLPQLLKKQLTQRGIQGIRDEVQDILFLLLKTCCPGAADEKAAILRALTDPAPCSKPESALNEMQRFWAAARRCNELGLAVPDVTILYAAFRSIFSNILTSAEDNLKLRWMCLENNLNLPHMVSFQAMREVAKFAEGELSFLALQGSKIGIPAFL